MSLRFPAVMFAFLLVIVATTAWGAEPAVNSQSPIVIRGGTLIDVKDFGRASDDVENSVIVIRGSKIESVGKQGEVSVPPDAAVIEADGTFIVPGYIEGFGVLKNQEFANAYLAMGVTGVVGVCDIDWRRGPMFYDADPSPYIYRFGAIGYDRAPTGTPEELVKLVDAYALHGVRVMLLLYHLDPPALRAVVARCKERGIATIGELGLATMKEALDAGVQSFVHTQRYSFDIVADDALRREYAATPFAGGPGSPIRRYLDRLKEVKPDDPRVVAHGEMLAGANVGLLPTLAMGASGLAWMDNPWVWPAAANIRPEWIHDPVDRATGKWAPDHPRAASAKAAPMYAMLDGAYAKAGAKFLAGSGVQAFGTLPGIALHVELEIMVREFGLTPREALAAATGNYPAIYGWKDAGLIEAGRRADILILDADPRTDVKHLRRIRTVIANGKGLRPETLLKLDDRDEK